MLALFLGNGCSLPRRTLQYTSHSQDKDLCNEIMQSALNLTDNTLRPFIKKQTYRAGTDKESTAINVFFPAIRKASKKYRNPLVLFFEKYGVYGQRHKNARIPSEIFKLSNKNKKLFIKYLWATDGQINNIHGEKDVTHIIYTSKSKTLVNQLQLLLQTIGILSKSYSVKSGRFSWHGITITSRYFQEKFLREIGVAGQRKGKDVDMALERISTMNPGWTKYELNEDRSVVYVPIKSIEKTEIGTAYDIEVDETHNFIANGIIVHNSIEQDADIVMFIHNPKPEDIVKSMDKLGKYVTVNEAENIRELIIAKNREGETGKIFLFWQKEITLFSDLEY